MLDQSFVFGFFAMAAAIVLGFFVVQKAIISVKPFETALIIKFGRCAEELATPGAHFRPALWIPGIYVLRVSRQLDYQLMPDIHVNDLDGTTLRVDLWLETRVKDARRSVFAVESWPEALRHLVLHTLMAKMGNTRLMDLIVNRDQISADMLVDIRHEAAEWGISIENLCVQDVRLLPEISKQLFDQVAATIELKKSRLEEEGRIQIQTMEAETDRKIAELQATARAKHPLAVGRAYQRLAEKTGILEGYHELNQLALLQPGKVVSFVGFGEHEISPMDAMIIPENGNVQSVTRSTRSNREV